MCDSLNNFLHYIIFHSVLSNSTSQFLRRDRRNSMHMHSLYGVHHSTRLSRSCAPHCLDIISAVGLPHSSSNGPRPYLDIPPKYRSTMYSFLSKRLNSIKHTLRLFSPAPPVFPYGIYCGEISMGIPLNWGVKCS